MTLKQRATRLARLSALPFIAVLTACGGGDGGYYDDPSSGSYFVVYGAQSNGYVYVACLNGSTVAAGTDNGRAVAQRIADYYGIGNWYSRSSDTTNCSYSGYARDSTFGVDFYNTYIR